MLRVLNMTSARSGREVANQFIIRDGNITMFQSYDSPIVEIDRYDNVITVYEDWNYSMTTGKYRNQFMREERLFDMDNKKGFEECMELGFCGEFKVVKAF